MSPRLSFSAHSLGHTFEDPDVTVFFGNRHSLLNHVALSFPDYQLLSIKQTHSDIVIASPWTEPSPEGDAHFTRERRLAICVRTADCVPVMIHDPARGFVASIHAGWRGVANQIVVKALMRLESQGADLGRARAWIGPHIGPRSFEVRQDVGVLLESRFDAIRGFSEEATALIEHPSGEKFFVNLLTIVRGQLRSMGIDPQRTLELPIDTFASADHQSHRRDREAAGRQMSFIALK
jgi:YfiH family protein